MSTEKKRFSSVFTRIGQGKKKPGDSDDEFDAKVLNIAQAIESPQGGDERSSVSTISRMKNRFGNLKINTKRNGTIMLDKAAPTESVNIDSVIASTVISTRSPSSETCPETDDSLASETTTSVNDADDATISPDLLQRRVSEVLEFEPSNYIEHGEDSSGNIVNKSAPRATDRTVDASTSMTQHKVQDGAFSLSTEEHRGETPDRPQSISHRRISK